MKTSFDTLADALDAGYTTVNHSECRDTSGPDSYGYEYTAPDGRVTTDVWLRKERNKGGGIGCVAILFPPEKDNE